MNGLRGHTKLGEKKVLLGAKKARALPEGSTNKNANGGICLSRLQLIQNTKEKNEGTGLDSKGSKSNAVRGGEGQTSERWQKSRHCRRKPKGHVELYGLLNGSMLPTIALILEYQNRGRDRQDHDRSLHPRKKFASKGGVDICKGQTREETGRKKSNSERYDPKTIGINPPFSLRVSREGRGQTTAAGEKKSCDKNHSEGGEG